MILKRKVTKLFLTCSLIASMLVTGIPMQAAASQGETGFVQAEGTKFTLDGSDFYYAGTNNYYINFKPAEDVDEVMKDAQDMGLTVIRTWGHLDAGTMTDEVDEEGFPIFTGNAETTGHKGGYYYQYYDADLGRPVVNHGETGLQMLDYVIAQAEKHNIKVIITLTNYWSAFGGMPQYCMWANKSNVEEFYTDDTLKSWFKNYIYEVLNHENVYTGRKLMDEPAIFSWELANEPRYDAQDKALEDNALYAWASEMSAYIKSIDNNHMVSIGDEGGMYYNEYTNHPGANPVPEGEAVNTGKMHWHGGMGNFHHLMQIDTIDFATPHLYPGVWGMSSEEELASWLKLHAEVAHEAGKPIILEEFGWSNKEVASGVTPYAAGRDTFFEYIYDAMIEYGYAGSNFWMLGAHTIWDAEGYYPDYDGFTVYNFEGPVSADGVDRYGTNEIIKAHAEIMNNMGNKNKLSVNAVAYDKANPKTCAVTVTPQTESAIASVALDGVVVAEGTAYTVSNNTITFKADYLNSLEESTYYATVDMTKGMSLQFAVEVSDSSIVSAVAGAGTYVFDKNLNVVKDIKIPVTVNGGGTCKGVYVLESDKTKTALSADAYTVSNDSVTIKANYLITRETGELSVILDYTKGTDPIVNIVINDTTGKDIVDKFESYESDSALSSAWSRNTNGGTVTPSLVAGQSDSTAMKFDFNTGSAGYAGITKATSGLAVTGFDGISFWIKAEDTTNNDLTIQLREKVSDYSSIYWEKICLWSELDAENGTEIKIPFEEFAPKASSYDGIVQPEAGQICGDNAVSEFSIYVGGSTKTNSFVIDDIKLYSDGEIVVIEPTATPAPTAAPTKAPAATPTPAATAAPTVAPAVDGGFYVNGTTIYDANGNPFEMRGVNIAHAWYASNTEESIKGAASLGANAVRIVLANGQQWQKTTYSEVSNIIEWCKENEVVCVLEVHDATGSDSTYALDNAVNYWIEMKDLLNDNTEYVIVNIANEWYGTWNGSAWAEGNKSAIQKLRDAGINNMLMVDCAGWGQYPDSIKDYGKQVFEADSHGNTVFSIHMYEYSGGNASTVKTNIDNALGTGVPLVIGEFGGQHTNGDVDEYTIMSYCEEKGVGYLGWSWRGNNSDLSYLDIANSWDGSSLTTWGKTLFNDTNGIKNTATTCTVYGGIVVVPTATPTAAPTATPTVAPTAKPTAAPTAKPTVAPTAAPTATPSEGAAYTNSATIIGANWWTSKVISKSDLIGNVDPSTVTSIKFSGNTDFYVGYNSTGGYKQPSGQTEYTVTDMALDNNYYLQFCLSKNDNVQYTVSWEVYTNSAVEPEATKAPVATAAPTAKPTAAPTAAPTAKPTVAPTAVPTAAPTAKPTAAPTATPTPEAGEDYSVVLEFEEENRYEQNGRNRVDSSMFSGYSGDGYVYLESGWGEVVFTVPENGTYRITLVSNADSYKENWLYLDNNGAGTLYTNGNSWGEYTAEYYLNAGTHKFGVSGHWGYVALDYVIIEAVE